jgi:hypothetical protein
MCTRISPSIFESPCRCTKQRVCDLVPGVGECVSGYGHDVETCKDLSQVVWYEVFNLTLQSPHFTCARSSTYAHTYQQPRSGPHITRPTTHCWLVARLQLQWRTTRRCAYIAHFASYWIAHVTAALDNDRSGQSNTARRMRGELQKYATDN